MYKYLFVLCMPPVILYSSGRNISSEQFDKMDGAWNHFVTFVKWGKKKWSRFNPPSNPSNLPQGARSSSHGLVESGSNAKEMSVNIEDILLRVQFFNMAASHSGALWNIRVSWNGTRNLKEAKVNENWVNHKLHQDILILQDRATISQFPVSLQMKWEWCQRSLSIFVFERLWCEMNLGG